MADGSLAVFGVVNGSVLAGVACLVLAAVYAVVYPGWRTGGPLGRTAGARFVVRWFHALVWVLLAGTCFAWRPGVGGDGVSVSTGLGVMAGVVYVVFLVVTTVSKAKA